MFRSIYTLVLFSSGLLAASIGFAETANTEKQYTVELLVFKNLIENDGGEMWPIDFSAWIQTEPEETSSTAAANRITWLGHADFRLKAQENALRSSRNYRPLAHIAWRQPVRDREHSQAINFPVTKSAQTGNYVDGTIRVAVERYLHLYLDLLLHTQGKQDEFELLEHELPEFRLKEQRRMRSGELHYFDHPRFGVLALITPFEEQVEKTAPASDETPTGQPPSAGGDVPR